jgi:hyaluronan synthase
MFKLPVTKKFILVTIIVLTSFMVLLLLHVQGYVTTFFWIYSILMTSFILTVHVITRSYRPVPDLGYRPTVSVIVPSKNEEDVIGRTVNSILASDYPQDKIEIVVVNDGSTDKTADVVRSINSPRVTLLDFKVNRGKRWAFASGVDASKNEIVICIDSDTLADEQAIKLLVQPFIDKEVVSVCGHGKAANENTNILTKLQHFWYQDMFRLIKGMESQLGAVSCCSGILAAYRRESILPVMSRWLNEKFFGRPILIGDDRQLTNLVLWKGLSTALSDETRKAKVVYQSNSIAMTFVPDRPKQFFKQQLRWKRAWVHGSLLAGRFMWKKKFPIPLIFYMYQFLTYASPVIIITAIIVTPLNGNVMATSLFLVGTFYVALLQGLSLWSFGYNVKAILYRILFVPLSFFMSMTVLLYAWSTPWKGGWVTRSEKNAKKQVA